jgi:hypothetical protein
MAHAFEGMFTQDNIMAIGCVNPDMLMLIHRLIAPKVSPLCVCMCIYCVHKAVYVFTYMYYYLLNLSIICIFPLSNLYLLIPPFRILNVFLTYS